MMKNRSMVKTGHSVCITSLKDSKICIWDGAFGLPSVDPFCMDLAFHIKFRRCDKITIEKNYWNINCPYLIINYDNFYTYESRIRQLVHQFTTDEIDDRCGVTNAKIIKRYRIEMFPSIEKAVLLTMWGPQENCKVTLQLFSKNIVPGLKFFVKTILKRRMRSELNINSKTLEDIDKVFESANTSLQFFSAVLGDKEYMFGDSVSTLEIAIVSYLAPILLYGYPNNKFLMYVNRYKNLIRFVHRFLAVHAPQDFSELEDPDRASTALILKAGGVALISMAIYTVWHHISGSNNAGNN